MQLLPSLEDRAIRGQRRDGRAGRGDPQRDYPRSLWNFASPGAGRLNPLSIESQMQGGVTFGMTQLMPRGAITLKDDRVEQRNWDGYTPPYIKDVPVAVISWRVWRSHLVAANRRFL
jgi:hypothetical protein